MRTQLDDFTKAYIEAALWSSTDENDVPLDNYDMTDFSDDALTVMRNDCEKFQKQAGDMIVDDLAGAGHDFWLTRNGHGAGFWDGDWPIDGVELTKLSDMFGECNLYIGDEGTLHIL